MISSYIALGYKCNHKCLNCPLSTFDRLHGELDRETIINNITKLSENGDNLHITISGGEPTLNPNFLEVLKILGSKNVWITILSNATTCKDKKMVDDIIDSLGPNYDYRRLNYVTAIHSWNKDIHDKLTGIKGSFNETMKGLENLNKKGIHISIKIIMNKKTAPDMKKTIDYVCEHFKENMNLELCATDYAGRCGKNLDELYISFEELEPLLEDTIDYFEKQKFHQKLQIIETPLCLTDPYYWKYFQVNPKKTLTYIAPNNTEENNRSEGVGAGCSTSYKECIECDVRSYCSGIWQSTYEIEKDKKKIIRPIKEMEGE